MSVEFRTVGDRLEELVHGYSQCECLCGILDASRRHGPGAPVSLLA
jgi:hypothetical protein